MHQISKSLDYGESIQQSSRRSTQKRLSFIVSRRKCYDEKPNHFRTQIITKTKTDQFNEMFHLETKLNKKLNSTPLIDLNFAQSQK